MRVGNAPPRVLPSAKPRGQLGKGEKSSPVASPFHRLRRLVAAVALLAAYGVRLMTANDNLSFAVRRSGSQKRQRNRNIGVPVDSAEFLSIEGKARAVGLSRAAFLRACALGAPGPRAKRSPSFEIEALAQATAALNKVGSNLNQIARMLNAGGSISLAHSSFAALTETRTAVVRILDIVGRRDRL